MIQRLKMPGNPRRGIMRMAAMAVLLALLGWYALPFAVQLPPELLKKPAASPVFIDRAGKPILRLALTDSTHAAPFTLADAPADLIACTLAAEDKRFFKHGGIDLLALLRATRDFIAQRRVVSGASTISQQLIKISSPPARRGPATKVREALAARRLEMTWSKEEILTSYLNRLDYGNLRFGSAEAARFYFQKPLADLSLAECALLAGLPQAPSRLNPIRHPQRAIARRNHVLERLRSTKGQEDARILSAIAEKPTFRPLARGHSAPWLAAQPVNSTLDPEIHTTLDLTLQTAIESIVRDEAGKLKNANLRHAAVVVIHNPTGGILALVSSADWSDPRGGQINGALVPRSPGSALKPFTYLLSMERNQRAPCSIIADIPTPFRTPQGLDLPENYDRTYRGPVTLRTALACSLNVPALRELNTLGGPSPLHELLTRLGISTLGDNPSHYGLGLTLGNAAVPLLELTNAYATLARGGDHLPPVLFPAEPGEAETRFSARSAWLIADILSDPSARAPAFQPGGPLDLPFRCAVKTGTSSDFRDNWCLGFTSEFTVGVWAGNFEHQPMGGISGLDGAGPIFQRAMIHLHSTRAPSWMPRPEGLVDVVIDVRNGKSITPGDRNSHLRRDIAPADALPPPASAEDYDENGKSRLDLGYSEWFASRHNLRRNDLVLRENPSSMEALRVISPTNNATFLLDPEIPSGSDKLRPVTNLPGVVLWKSDTLRIEPGTPEPVIHLTPGTHTLIATDPRNHHSQTIILRVKSL